MDFKLTNLVRKKPLAVLTLAASIIYPFTLIVLAGGFSEIYETFGWAFVMFLWITSPLILLTFLFSSSENKSLTAVGVFVLISFLVSRTLLMTRALLGISVEYEGIWMFTLPGFELLVVAIAAAMQAIGKRVGHTQN